MGSHGAGSLNSNVESFAQAGTVTSDALGTPFATFAPDGAAAAVAWIGLFADAADLVENGMAIYLPRWWAATNRWVLLMLPCGQNVYT